MSSKTLRALLVLSLSWACESCLAAPLIPEELVEGAHKVVGGGAGHSMRASTAKTSKQVFDRPTGLRIVGRANAIDPLAPSRREVLRVAKREWERRLRAKQKSQIVDDPKNGGKTTLYVIKQREKLERARALKEAREAGQPLPRAKPGPRRKEDRKLPSWDVTEGDHKKRFLDRQLYLNEVTNRSKLDSEHQMTLALRRPRAMGSQSASSSSRRTSLDGDGLPSLVSLNQAATSSSSLHRPIASHPRPMQPILGLVSQAGATRLSLQPHPHSGFAPYKIPEAAPPQARPARHFDLNQAPPGIEDTH